MADIEIRRDGSIAFLRLSRPGKKNALTNAMHWTIAEALNDADADAAVKALVIEAEGPDFCAGNDLAMMADMASGKLPADELASDDFLAALSGFGKPLLAAVRGRAIGVGATLLMHCDVVVVAQDSRLTFPFVDLSVVPEAASTYLVPARIGYARAYSLLCLCEPVTGADAAEWGLVTRSVESADVDDVARDLALRLAGKPASALRATKVLMKDRDAIERALASDKEAFLRQIGLQQLGQSEAASVQATGGTPSTGVQA